MSGGASEIFVPSGEQRAETLRIDHGSRDLASYSLRVQLEAGSSLKLQELHRGAGRFSTRIKVKAELGPDAKMRHVAVLDDAGEGRYDNHREARLGDRARLDYVRIGSGAARDVEVLRTRMEGARSRLRHQALMMVERGRLAELDLELAHLARNAESESLCRCVLGERGEGRFAGKILISTDGNGADARLRNDNLLLHESAHMETRPELEVYADEVQCAHGAATGALDEAALFYLMSRGLPAARAQAMLVRAFVSRISNGIGLEEAEGMTGDMLARVLNDDPPESFTA